MTELAEIITFLEEQTGLVVISENCDIRIDLGVDGDDFFDLVTEFSKRYNVDISSCLWYFHWSEEGSWNSIGSWISKSPDKRVTYIPVTPLMLTEFANKGKWDIQYPDHQLPKRRYDLMLNGVLFFAFIAWVFYKYVF